MRIFPILLITLLFFSCSQNKQDGGLKLESHLPSNVPKLTKAPFGKEIIEAFVPFVAPAVRSKGLIHCSYELQLANNYNLPLTLTKIELFDPNHRDTALFTFDSRFIQSNIQRPGAPISQPSTLFEGGQFGLVNLSFSLPNKEQPNHLFHKLHFTAHLGADKNKDIHVEKAFIQFPEVSPIVLSPPFQNGNWMYMTDGHKNTRELTEGKASYAQRYASDWVYLEKDGRFVHGPRNQNSSFLSYGKDILAVANGVVLEIQDSIPDNPGEGNERATKINRYSLSGNHLVLDIGNQILAVYAHLIPGSFKVKTGDKVQVGDVLASLGNSGESEGPHLHFHLETKTNWVLGGEGIPYHFKSYQEMVRFETAINLDSLFSGTHIHLPEMGAKKQNEFPMGTGIVRFD